MVSTPSLGPSPNTGSRTLSVSPGGKAEALSERMKSQGSPLLRRPFMKAQSLASADDGGGHLDASAGSGSSAGAPVRLDAAVVDICVLPYPLFLALKNFKFLRLYVACHGNLSPTLVVVE